MRQGFTTIELFIVVGIMIIIVAAALPLYSNLHVSAQLNETNAQIAQTIRIAREQSISRLNNAPHGVKFYSDSYILYQGTSYASRSSLYDRTVTLDSPLSIASTLASDEINFTLATGMPNTTGTITITHSVGDTRSVTINSFGTVEED